MNDMFGDVGLFHEKFGLPRRRDGGGLTKLTPDVLEFRTKFMQEELDEFRDADTFEKQADALVDLVYVALGTAQMMRFAWAPLWAEVQRANMAKERAVSADDPRSTRSHALDVVKPVGWRPPDVAGALDRPPHVDRKWSDHHTRLALAAARTSSDAQKVGAVVAAPDQTVAGVGFNGPPRSCDVPAGFGHKFSFHAEENAIYFAVARLGLPLPGRCWLYSTHRPCARCVRTAAHFGIHRVHWLLDALRPEQAAETVEAALVLGVVEEMVPWPD